MKSSVDCVVRGVSKMSLLVFWVASIEACMNQRESPLLVSFDNSLGKVGDSRGEGGSDQVP